MTLHIQIQDVKGFAGMTSARSLVHLLVDYCLGILRLQLRRAHLVGGSDGVLEYNRAIRHDDCPRICWVRTFGAESLCAWVDHGAA